MTTKPSASHGGDCVTIYSVALKILKGYGVTDVVLNVGPVATDDAFSVSYGSSLSADVLGNDTDADGD